MSTSASDCACRQGPSEQAHFASWIDRLTRWRRCTRCAPRARQAAPASRCRVARAVVPCGGRRRDSARRTLLAAAASSCAARACSAARSHRSASSGFPRPPRSARNNHTRNKQSAFKKGGCLTLTASERAYHALTLSPAVSASLARSKSGVGMTVDRASHPSRAARKWCAENATPEALE